MRARSLGVGESPAKSTWSFVVMLFWFIGFLAGPVFGYYLTRITGWVNEDNWRALMWVRLSACFLWPCGAAVLHSLVNGPYDRNRNWKTTLSMVVVSSYGGYMALN